MRFFAFPVAALAVISGGFNDEPTEIQMQRAFETSLQRQVANTLGFIAETGGLEAVWKIRDAGSDRFTVRSFRKLNCSQAEGPGYLCSFAVDIELMNGNLQRRIDGRFVPTARGQLAFAESI
jgi:hypothetical protein